MWVRMECRHYHESIAQETATPFRLGTSNSIVPATQGSQVVHAACYCQDRRSSGLGHRQPVPGFGRVSYCLGFRSCCPAPLGAHRTGASQVRPGPPFRCRDGDESLAYSAQLAASNVLPLVHRGFIGISEAQAVEQLNSTFRVTWPLKHLPRVSVIIPTVDSPDLIRNCVEGLLEKTDYPDKEVILIDSGTTDPITLSLYREWSSSGGVSIIPFNEPFNYSMACNLGAGFARGEYLLFLNNDTEMIDPGWLEELVRWAQRPGVGVVGTKLLYPDGKIQHAGVVFSDIPSHIFSQQYDDLATAPAGAIFGTPSIYRNVTAVTGACQLLRRSLFDEIGGYDTRSLIAGSDI